MCGIAGVVGHRPAEGTIERMTAAQAHRGPDASGIWRDGDAALGHRRLSILDLESGAQPMANEDGNVVVTYNGEIYNHAEIRRDLEARGHRFRTDHADTEVIVHAYEEWGDAAPERFNGIFAFALWDRRRRRALLARDRLGVKPLYHAAVGPGGTGLAFASEAKALLGSGLVLPRLDEDALDVHLALRYVPAPRTLFVGIEKVPPGHTATWEAGRLTVRPYWRLEPREDLDPTEAEAAEELRGRLDAAVRGQMMSDVPLGVFLSGGVDSSVVAALAARARTEPVSTFNIDFVEAGYSEAHFARSAAEAVGTRHHETRLDRAAYLGWLDDLVWHLDEPLADAAATPLRFVAAHARANRHVVLLSGEGADEILGGYSYGRFPLYRRLAGALRALPTRMLLRLGYLGRDELRRLVVVREIAEVHSQTLPFVEEERRRLRPRGDSGAAARLLGAVDAALPPGVSGLGRILAMDTATWLPEDLLLKADKMTMAVGVELRVPFLDHTIVEWAFRLPPRLKHAGGVGKRILKRAARGVVPDSILDRPKQGFPVPVSRWFREIPEWGDEVASPGHPLVASGRIRRGAVGALVDLHRRGGVDLGNGLLTLLMLGRWMKRFGVS